MPELPEVETTKKGITPYLIAHVITKLLVRNARLRWAIPANLADHVEGTRINTVLRRGKYLLLGCYRDQLMGYILIHLGMSGNLGIVAADVAVKKHDHVDWQLDSGLCLRYHDPRRFGCVLWTQVDWQAHPLIASLGIEPLSIEFDGTYLYQRANAKKQVVKNFLMDSHQVVGVGNIYASESLFMANIHPNMPAGQISLIQYQTLVTAIVSVLTAAIAQGGTSLKDFRQSDGKPGYFKQALQVYGRKNEPCFHCKTPIEQIRIGQRASYFCPQCQII